MNNSAIQEETTETPNIRAGQLTTLIESAGAILTSKEWSTLKTEFDLGRLERLLATESRRKEINLPEIYRLQGRIEENKRLDLEGMRTKWLLELEAIKKLT